MSLLHAHTHRSRTLTRMIKLSRDPNLFALVEEHVMTNLNKNDEQYNYVLWKDGSDVTEIRYSEG